MNDDYGIVISNLGMLLPALAIIAGSLCTIGCVCLGVLLLLKKTNEQLRKVWLVLEGIEECLKKENGYSKLKKQRSI